MTGAPDSIGPGWLWRRTAGARGWLVVVACGIVLDLSLEAALPLGLRWLIDQAVLGGRPETLAWIMTALGIGAIAAAGMKFLRDYGVARVAALVAAGLRADLFTRLQRLSHDFHSRHSVAGLLTHFTGDLVAIERAVAEAIPVGLLPALGAVVGAVLLFSLEWRLALVVAVVWPLSVLGPACLASQATRAGLARSDNEAKLLAVVQENLLAQTLVKALALGETVEPARFEAENRALAASSMRASFLSGVGLRTGGVAILLLQILVLGLGTWMAARRQITVGTLAAFQTVLLGVGSSLTNCTQYYPTLINATGAFRQLRGLFSQVNPVVEAGTRSRLSQLQGRVEFREVRFAYQPGPDHPAPKPALERVSFAVSPGEQVALVGPSGSGKSTVLSLLLRFYDPQSGEILIDGKPLCELDAASFRGFVGVVFQESFLFNLSLRENIRIGRLEATDAEVEEAARLAEIHDFIRDLPKGYDTVAGPGGIGLSGGQRQRIAIARALIRKPAILLLDEATTALDPGTEAAIQATLRRVGRGRVVLAVTHRLNQVVASDRILVLENGLLVEQGGHAALLAAGGAYARLWRKQSGFSVSSQGDYAELSPEHLTTLPILELVPAELRPEVARSFVTERYATGQVVCREGDPGDRFYVIARGRVEVTRRRPARSDTRGNRRKETRFSKSNRSARAAARSFVTATQDPTLAGGEQLLKVLDDGDYFGEIALLTASPRTATVRTRTDCVLLSLGREQFHALLTRFPGLQTAVGEVSRARLGELGTNS